MNRDGSCPGPERARLRPECAEEDDGSLGWWLRLAAAVESIDSRSGRVAHQERVRQAICAHTDRLFRWNVAVCDSLSISVTEARLP
jgi:hypothetical protein